MFLQEAQPKPEKPWLSRRRYWVILVVVVGLLTLLFATVFCIFYVTDVPLRVSPETTILTEPLTADGRVDYVAAAEPGQIPPEMATDLNGFRHIVRQLGPAPSASPEVRRQTCEILGLDPNISPTMAYEQPWDYLMRYAAAEYTAGNVPPNMNTNQFATQLDSKMADPWTLDEFPMMADWLTDNGPALDLVAEAVRQPTFHIPWVRSDAADSFDAVSMEEFQRLFGIARGFQLRAKVRMGTGDIDGAIDDIVACARLGRLPESSGFIGTSLFGIAAESLSFSIGAGSSLQHQPPEAQWQRLLEELNQLPEREEISGPLETQRWALLDAVQSISRGDFSALVGSRAKPLRTRDYGIDWNIVMQRGNERYDELLGGAEFARPDASTLVGRMNRGRRSYLLGEYLSASILGVHRQYGESRHRVVCKESLLRIVIAMLLYEKEHGTLPPAYSVDEQGTPLHSWRVLLLPYLGYDDLYADIRLDEPWDSSHNQQFHAADVPIFQCPSAAQGAGMTTYTVVEGLTCAFDGGVGKRLDAFGPRSAHLVLVAERVNPVCWMDPLHEISFADACLGINRPGVNGLGSEHEGGLHIGLRSGAVKFISENIDLLSIPHLLDGTIDRPY